ncbi:MAG TPA: triple tyrosine motif-containing protein [Saprospiraceae bacterium]|nr:triple tyrosine motif-containing protein [Saprospiraceae bacterium]
MALRICVALAFIFLLNTAVPGQKELNFTYYKETQGVEIWEVLSDQFGRIWLGTSDGLMRFEGYEFKRFVYDPKDSSSIKGAVISTLYEDALGNIWISAFDERLYRFDPRSGSFKTYPFFQLIGKTMENNDFGISTISMDAGGRLYFGANSVSPLPVSLLIYDESGDRIRPFPLPDSANPGGFYLARPDHAKNTLFLGLDNQLFFFKEGKSLSRLGPYTELQNLANQTSVLDFIFDQEDRLWFMSDQGSLAVFDKLDGAPLKTYSFRHLLPDPSKPLQSCILKLDQNKNLWIGLDKGLIRFDLKNEKSEFFKLPKDHRGKNYEVRSLNLDSFNNLWIGTQNGLLKHEDKPVFINYTSKNDDTASTLKGYAVSLTQAGKAKILVLSYEVGTSIPVLNELDLQTNTIKKHHIGSIFPKGSMVFGVQSTGTDTLLFGTDHGVYRLNLDNKRAQKVSLKGVPNIHPGILQFYTDAFGNEWLGTLSYLYKKPKGSEEFVPMDLSRQPGGTERSNMVRVEDGKSKGLWLLTDNGLYLYDFHTDSITRHGYDKKTGDVFLNQSIYAVVQEDSSDIVWVGMQRGGLNRYNSRDKKIKTYTTEDGLADISVYAILHDEKNRALWLGTGQGISRFDLQSEKFTNFSTEDGLDSKRYYPALKTTDGRFFFSGEELIQFNPDEISLTAVPPLISFGDVKVSIWTLALGWGTRIEKGLTDDASLTLNHDENNITIEYLGGHYSNPAKNRFSYILENYDDRWIDVGSQQAAYFTNLPPGKYVFRVKAANSNGIWNEQGIKLNIQILYPWWRTYWAYALYLVGLAGMASVANRYFKQRVLKRERDRTQLKELEQARLIEKAYRELESSHQALKATQSKLIQSEKMASLGELTAGIAHEIQNPLNFVNNFAEVNQELIGEIEGERTKQKEDRNEQLETQLLQTLKENEQKIHQHGQRADAIVKSMLQHSRTSSSKKEPTDLNTLCDEYLRLSYHGLRAKDPDFKAKYELDPDPELPRIDLVPQDMSRVLLNLINNAFYAVNEKRKRLGTAAVNERAKQNISGYEPLVRISTRRNEKGVEIRVKDNGPGIPEQVREKIFQPFFTTKPTGQGTGLGLSLPYDIVKAHGGDIKVISNYFPPSEELGVETDPGSYTEFIIHLPV